MATKPSSGTDCPPRARIRNSRPGLLPEAASAGAPERRLFVPERGFVAIFGPISRTMGRAQADGERPDKPAGVRRRAARSESRHPAADGLERFSRKARWPQPSSTEIRAPPPNRDSHGPQCRSPSPSPKARTNKRHRICQAPSVDPSLSDSLASPNATTERRKAPPERKRQSHLSRFGNGTRALRQAKAAHPRPIRGILPQRNPRESVESPSHRKASRKETERKRRTKATEHALMAVWGTHLHVELLPVSVESPRQRPGQPAGQSPAGASEAPARRAGPYGAPGQRGSARDPASVSSCQSWLRLHQLPHAARFGRVLRPVRDRPEVRRRSGDRRGRSVLGHDAPFRKPSLQSLRYAPTLRKQ